MLPIVLCLGLAIPASAVAQNSGVDEYQENPPNGGGGGGGQETGGAGGTPETASGPPPVASVSGSGGGDEGLGGFAEARGLGEKERDKGAGLGPDRGGLGDALDDVAGGSGGLGALLPIILVATLLGGGLLLFARWRSAHHA